MPHANPYETPGEAELPSNSSDGLSEAATNARLILYAQLGLRLLGIMFVVEGASTIIGCVTIWFLQSSEPPVLGYPPDPYPMGWTLQGLAYLAAGIYLAVGGRWVIESVFTPAMRQDDASDAEPGDDQSLSA